MLITAMLATKALGTVLFGRQDMQPPTRNCAHVFPMILMLSFLICAFGSRCAAQENTGSLNGNVKDSSDAVIANATIKLTNLNTDVTQTKESSKTGLFRLVNVVTRRYRVEVRV